LSSVRQNRVQFDQSGPNSQGVISFGQHLQNIATVACAEAQDRTVSLVLIKCRADVGLDLA
jgi:hypothetical protein